MDRNQKPGEPAGKFGKFLAVGMTVALIWGLILMIFGIYLRFKFGTLITSLLGNIEEVVHLQSAISEHGQNIVPITVVVSDDIDVGYWQHLLAIIVMTLAVMTIVFACLGIYGGLNHNKIALYVTIVLLLITALHIIGLISITADAHASFHKEAQIDLIERIHTSYKILAENDMFILAMNSIMLWFQCCGIVGVRDFYNLTFVEANPGTESKEYHFNVAPACCIRDIFNGKSDIIPAYVRLRDCAEKGYAVMQQLNSKGCYNEVYDVVSSPATGILILILIWNVLVLLLTVLTIMEIKPEEERRPSFKAEPKEEAEEIPVVKKFVPYAKISSFTTADLNRIKSTEIW